MQVGVPEKTKKKKKKAKKKKKRKKTKKKGEKKKEKKKKKKKKLPVRGVGASGMGQLPRQSRLRTFSQHRKRAQDAASGSIAVPLIA